MKLPNIRSGLALATASHAFSAIANANAYSNATTNSSNDENGSNGINVDTLSWGACDNAPTPLECASFQVPLDWADESKGNIKLAVIRLPHNKTQSYEGYMFYNPGGPGDSGVDFIAGFGDDLQSQIGRGWDVVSWDPRGVDRSEPNITLFSNQTERDLFWSQLEGRGNLDAHGNLTTQSDIDFFMSQASSFDNFLQSFNDKFVAKHGDKLKYIGSAAVVRDLVALTEAIYGRGADINFYGFSYGTVLGAYLTQMFPDRVGKVIIDGVADPPAWANEPPMTALPIYFETTEGALQGWASYCADAPEKCGLAKIVATLNNQTETVTASDILAVIDQIFITIYQTYDGTPTTLTYSEFGQLVAGVLYSPANWYVLDEALVEILSGQFNATSGTNTTTSKRSNVLNSIRKRRGPSGFDPDPRANVLSSALWPISCGDAIDPSGSNSTTQDLLQIIVNIANTISPHFASDYVPQTACHKWTSRAVERLPVPFTTRPKNVILVIGNTLDVITPYSSAQKIASDAHLGSMARLVKFNAVGHTSYSTCIDNVIHSFVNGDIPADAGDDGPDVECDIDGNPFNNF